jgi:hypothetical protein
MANIIGDVSLTNKTGVFLGSVNLSNLNASAGDIVFSPDGFDLSGLALSDGLSSNGSQISTVGNPNIQMTANSIYVNENSSTIQSAVNAATAPDTIFISSGSYNETVNIANKSNIALINNSTNSSTICEVLNGLNITGTSENIRVSNLQIEGTSCNLSGVGRNIYSNCVFTGTIATPLNITIGASSTAYMTFRDCGFNQYCNITVANTFADVVYFINCNFGGATITLSQASPLQVIINNCANLNSFPVNATYVGINVLTSGTINLTTTNINGSAYPPSAGVTVANQGDNRIITATATTDALNGEANLTFNGTTLTQNTINYHVGGENVQINEFAQTGNNSVAIGHQARAASSCVSIGYEIGRVGMTGQYNVLIGRSTAKALTSGNGNVIIGGNACQQMTTGTNNTIVGVSSGVNQTTQNNNTIFGYNSRCTDTLGVTQANCGAFGEGISNMFAGTSEIQIGNSGTIVYAYAFVSRSDERDKADIRENELGLNFIEKLKPKQYRFNYREDYNVQDADGNITQLPNDGSKKRNRYHNGFLAQDIAKTTQELNADFAGIKHGSHNGGSDVYSLDYNEFISPLVKAVQELSEKVKILEAKLLPA